MSWPTRHLNPLAVVFTRDVAVTNDLKPMHAVITFTKGCYLGCDFAPIDTLAWAFDAAHIESRYLSRSC